MECILTLANVNDTSNSEDTTLHNSVRNVIMLMLPGIISTCVAIANDSDLQNHNISVVSSNVLRNPLVLNALFSIDYVVSVYIRVVRDREMWGISRYLISILIRLITSLYGHCSNYYSVTRVLLPHSRAVACAVSCNKAVAFILVC